MKKPVIFALMTLFISFNLSAQNYTLEKAIQMAVENIEETLGQRSPDDDVSLSEDSALKEMESEQTDFDSIRQRAQSFNEKPIIAVIGFNSESDDLSAYLVEELSSALASGGGFTIVDRQLLDVIQAEENFQMSGSVSDKHNSLSGKNSPLNM